MSSVPATANPKSSSQSLTTSPEDLSSQTGKSTDTSDGLTLRVSLPRACKKMIVADKSTATPSAIKSQEEEGVEEDEEEPGEEKYKKSPDDYQSAVAQHLLENEACLRAYTDNSFCIVCVCSSKYLSLDVMEALFIRSLSPNLCVQSHHSHPCSCSVPLSTHLSGSLLLFLFNFILTQAAHVSYPPAQYLPRVILSPHFSPV